MNKILMCMEFWLILSKSTCNSKSSHSQDSLKVFILKSFACNLSNFLMMENLMKLVFKKTDLILWRWSRQQRVLIVEGWCPNRLSSLDERIYKRFGFRSFLPLRLACSTIKFSDEPKTKQKNSKTTETEASRPDQTTSSMPYSLICSHRLQTPWTWIHRRILRFTQTP